MTIQGIEGMSGTQLNAEIEKGAKFVVFPYVISIGIMTFSRNSNIIFVRAGESATIRALPYAGISLLLGWWGFPWGLIRTPIAIVTNLGGGKNVTPIVLAYLAPAPATRGLPPGEFDLGL